MKIDIIVKDFEVKKHIVTNRTEHLENTSEIYVTVIVPEHLREIIENEFGYSQDIYNGNARVRFVYPSSVSSG